MQIIKEGLRKANEIKDHYKPSYPDQYLLSMYTTSGVFPSKLLIGQGMQNYLDLVLPSTKSHVVTHQAI